MNFLQARLQNWLEKLLTADEEIASWEKGHGG
jgi:hypothetical protein